MPSIVFAVSAGSWLTETRAASARISGSRSASQAGSSSAGVSLPASSAIAVVRVAEKLTRIGVRSGPRPSSSISQVSQPASISTPATSSASTPEASAASPTDCR